MKLLKLNERKQLVSDIAEINPERLSIAQNLVRQLNDYPIEDPALRSIAFDLKQLLRDHEIARVYFLSDQTRADKVRYLTPFCKPCELNHRKNLQQVLIADLHRITAAIDHIITVVEQNFNRKVAYGIRDVDTVN